MSFRNSARSIRGMQPPNGLGVLGHRLVHTSAPSPPLPVACRALPSSRVRKYGSPSSESRSWRLSLRVAVAAASVTASLASRKACGQVRAEDKPELEAKQVRSQALRDMWMGQQGEHEWLENVLGDDALGWVRGQNSRTEALLGDPTASALYNKSLQILESKDKIPNVAKYGAYWYNFWTDADHPRGLWRRTTRESFQTDSPAWEVVIDVDALGKDEGESWVWKGHAVCREFDAATGEPLPPRRTLVALSPGGSDAVIRREFDMVEKRFISAGEGGFVITPAMKSRASWIDYDTILVGGDLGSGSLTDSGYPRVVREWRRGTLLADAPQVFEGEASDVSVTGYVSRSRGHTFEWRHRALSFYTSRREVRSRTASGGSSWTCLEDRGLPEGARTSQFADRLLIWLRKPWEFNGQTLPAGSLLSTGIEDFCSRGVDAKMEILFLPTSRTSLKDFDATRNYLVLHILDNVKSKLHFWRWAGGDADWVDAGEEPSAVIRGASVQPVDSEESDEYFLSTSSFTQPSSLSLADASLGPAGVPSASPLKQLPMQFDASGLTASQGEATSADGTKIPYFCVCRDGLPRDGSTPTLLYGYGGFEISMTPGYTPLIGTGWLERGGCYVVANIRGGGEFGPAWHQAALRENRQKAYDDFVAVAEDLVASGVTSPGRLGIRGGSNGGLLMGNMLVQRPDLFGAVVCAVPLLDMKRYSHLLAGASWMAEYGNPDTEDWQFLQKYSPYHNLDPNASYPPLLMTTSTKDDRVHPYHARCFVKRLQEMGKGDNVFYFENIEGGHGGAADAKQSAYVTSLYIDFLWKVLCPADPDPASPGAPAGEGSPGLEAIYEEAGQAAELGHGAAGAGVCEDDEGRRITELLLRFDATRLRSELQPLYVHRMHYQSQQEKKEPDDAQAFKFEIDSQSRVMAAKLTERQRGESGKDLPTHADVLHWRYSQTQEKKEQARIQAKVDEAISCTFRPKTTSPRELYVDITTPPGASRAEVLYARGLAEKERRDAKVVENERMQKTAETRDCTFRPCTADSKKSYHKAHDGQAQAPVPRGFYETRQRLRAANEIRGQRLQQQE
ncbi:unnamed protein product, partial [Polarella glacialis]